MALKSDPLPARNQPHGSPPAGVSIQQRRERQTDAPPTPFRDLLAGSAAALTTGAEVAASVAGVPPLAVAVHSTGEQLVSAIQNRPAGESLGGPGGGEMDRMFAMQRESQAFNLQLLALQQEVQDENRRFSTLTNVLRAKHDTAKAAVGNVRS